MRTGWAPVKGGGAHPPAPAVPSPCPPQVPGRGGGPTNQGREHEVPKHSGNGHEGRDANVKGPKTESNAQKATKGAAQKSADEQSKNGGSKR